MTSKHPKLGFYEYFTYFLFTFAGMLLGMCFMLVKDQAKVEPDKFNVSKIRVTFEEECSRRIDETFKYCHCVPGGR